MFLKLQQVIRKIQFKLVTYRHWIEMVMRVLTAILCLAAATAIIWEHGSYLDASAEHWVSGIVIAAYVFYIAKFFLRWFYSGKRSRFLKDNLLDAFVILGAFIILLFGDSIGRRLSGSTIVAEHYKILFFHIYYFIIFFIELAKGSTLAQKVNMSPPLLMMLSFFVLIICGTGLLLLPKMTTNGISLIDALFTSTSASCVTGLTVVNTATTFTTSGHIVLMLLMQMGGMSILSFATFFISFLSHSYTGLRYQYMVKDMLSTNRVSDSFSFLREIIVVTFIIEGAGTLLLYMYWRTTGIFETEGETIFFALFHAISAFNNAGFSLWPNNLMDTAVVNNYFPQIIIMILVFAGGIGYVVLRDFFNPNVIHERKLRRWKKLTDGTQIALISSFVIIVVGAVLFYIIESKYTLADKGNVLDRAFTSVFQVVAGRTAGFNIVDVDAISVPMLLIFILIIFIGASPGSTGGGIKTTTAFVILKSILATIKGKKRIEFHKKTIPFSLVDKAYSIVVMSLSIIFVSTVILAVLEPVIPLKNVLFEATSAFTTCGLSTGCIDDFSVAGKAVLTVNMYIGRIGTLTFAYALSKRTKESRHEYPETYFMVG